VPTTTRDLHKIQTEQFIDANSTYVTLHRFSRVPDGAGGMKPGTEEILGAQYCRVVHQTRPMPHVTEEGLTVLIDKVIVGTDGLDVAVGDTFTYANRQYQVINAFDEPGWHRRVAEAIHHG